MGMLATKMREMVPVIGWPRKGGMLTGRRRDTMLRKGTNDETMWG
jgi:hypothetical protein